VTISQPYTVKVAVVKI